MSSPARVLALSALVLLGALLIFPWRPSGYESLLESAPPATGAYRPGVALASGPAAGPESGGVKWEKAYHHNNLGVAHMEQHRYGTAAEEFQRVTVIAPGWVVGHINLGIAFYSAHKNEKAETAFRRALEIDPDSPYPHYGLGLLQKVRGERELAIGSFERVVQIDAQDADAHYNLGLLYQWTADWENSTRHLEEAMALDPTNASAVYKLATALINSGRTEQGQAMMERFRKMSADPSLGTTRGLQYGEQGRYAEVVTGLPGTTFGFQEAPPPVPVRFVDVARQAGLRFRHLGPGDAPGGSDDAPDDPRRRGSGAAIGDVNGDGLLDLCFAEVGGASGPALRLFRNAGGMKFTDVTAAVGLSVNGTGLACYLGDLDNDGDLDLFLSAAEGGNRLFRNNGQGKFSDSTREAGLPGDGSSAGGALADVDHDGDLDLYLLPAGGHGRTDGGRASAAAGTPQLWINDGSGTFLRASDSQAPQVRAQRPTGLAFSDFDNDRDIDFILTDGRGAPRLYSNLRGGRWEDVAGSRGLAKIASAHSAAVGDFNKDGFMDLALAGAQPALLWQNDKGVRFRPVHPRGLEAAPETLSPVFLDFDNDGFLDLFSAGSGQPSLLLWRNLGGGRFADASSAFDTKTKRSSGLRGAVAADLDEDGDVDLLVTRNGDTPLLLRNDGGSRNKWLRVRPRGVRSTKQGIGTKVEVQAGGLWQKAEVNGGSGYLSQGPPELMFGLGERTGAEFVRLLWPGGVLQSEMEIAAGRLLEVEELDRKGSSCPVLYAWDGTRFVYVNDFIGGGGIGFLVAPGRYTRPDPTEYVMIDGALLQPLDGWLELRVVQQLEEVAYIDRLELVIVDHAADTEILPNERFMIGPPYPEFEVYEISEKVLPRTASDGSGRDRTAALQHVDRIYADGLRLLPWPGYAEPHELILEFGPEATADGWKLFLNGWVDYGYSYANYAAAQAGLGLTPPRLERAAGEDWEVVAANTGYPAGNSRTMVAAGEITWIGDDRRLRLSTNMRIFWDQAFLARPARLDPDRLSRLRVARADLRFLGFPREFSPDGRKPYVYDYSLAASTFPWKSMRGRFTRYGEVRELLLHTDDRFVIMNRGDEIALSFDARRLPSPHPGWKRDYLLFADGYAKDMDPHGAHPDTVEPLPFHTMTGYPYGPGERYPGDRVHRDYIEKWNTRELWNE